MQDAANSRMNINEFLTSVLQQATATATQTQNASRSAKSPVLHSGPAPGVFLCHGPLVPGVEQLLKLCSDLVRQWCFSLSFNL